jgi:cytochrome P450 family 724 subfamily B polypeptide 1
MFNIAKKFIYNGRWKIKSDEMPIAHPYVEFKRGMLLEIEPTKFLED